LKIKIHRNRLAKRRQKELERRLRWKQHIDPDRILKRTAKSKNSKGTDLI
jgi:hypothetical protein